MHEAIITLTTDFGEDSPYVACMKGIILGINANARILDLSHQIPPQDIAQTAFFLATAIPCFPRGVIHVVVVDPGVGSERALLYVELDGHRLLCPDNGCWTSLLWETDALPAVIRLENASYWRRSISATFHGRDILAPVAAHLGLGVEPEKLGTPVSDFVRLPRPAPEISDTRIRGAVATIDHFGNLISNIPASAILSLGVQPLRIRVDGQAVAQIVTAYSDATPGSTVALISSDGRLEVAVVQGHAARHFKVGAGAPVTVEILESAEPHAVRVSQR